MKRTLMKDLRSWKNQPARKPLILKGARQVGKTYLLKEFGKLEYQNTIYLNFEDRPGLCKLFEANLEPEKILKSLTIEMDAEITAGKSLIIFDEVQECPTALNSLKYFCENAPDQHIIAAGSLLGVKLAHKKGFPVGKVQFLTLYPLSFLEFLEAVREIRLKEYIEELKTIEPLPPNLHDKLLGHFKEYLFVGGMPEAVFDYSLSQDFAKVREIQNAILSAYSLDFAKHAPKDQVMKINQVWNSIPNQLAKENKKFIYTAIREGARAKEFEIALQWLIEAGLILKVSNISTPKIPLSAYAELNIFKIYLVDVGLLGAMSNLSAKTILYENELFQEFKGSLTENYVAQELAHSKYQLFYWTSKGEAELDFVLEQDGLIYPLEVKSGDSSKKKSLRLYGELYQPELLIRTSPMNLKKDGDMLNCPLYLTELINQILDNF
ncbi:MAG TPA: ATP-binding protein [Rhabdochlamydiaceae bacterium]|nr:ATP-binding protein [Rhabdochlamydiaceae bacterium]